MEASDDSSSDLRTRVLGQAAREHTIASQTAALIEFAKTRGFQVPDTWVFEDEGYSGASLVRRASSAFAIWRPKARSTRYSSIEPIA